ncbi:MAG TPA: cytochrome c [Candidatus Obscuribacterales bacterium]
MPSGGPAARGRQGAMGAATEVRRTDRPGRGSLTLAAAALAAAGAAACSMPEEVKRIEAVRRAELRMEAAGSTNLTGEQIFIRSCNTCHPGGKEGMGPSLALLDQHLPDDQSLKAFIRKGKGIMPAQPREALNDEELDSLVAYLRRLSRGLSR